MLLMSVSKKSSVDQSELEKWVASHCQLYYAFIMCFTKILSLIRFDDRKDIQSVKSTLSILHSEYHVRVLSPL